MGLLYINSSYRLSYMERKGYFSQIFLRLSHLPTFILIVGYTIWWIELYCIKKEGVTSYLAYILVFLFSVFLLLVKRKQIFNFFFWFLEEYKKQNWAIRSFLLVSFITIFLIGVITFLALLKPPHLPQEFDSLNYHLTLPRQHLLVASFKHIPWSSADLFPLPIQFALAPYWLIGEIPNKFIHIFFVFGLVAVSIRMVRKISGNNFLSVCILMFAILGSHNVGIQLPVLMLDIIICYLFIASLDSFLNQSFILGIVEFSFFFWSKSFYPLMSIFIFSALGMIFLLMRTIKGINFSFTFGYELDKQLNRKLFFKLLSLFFVVSILIGLPFVAKSIYYAGTPLFPFFPGIIDTPKMEKDNLYRQSIVHSAQRHLSVKDNYGSGRSLLEFIKHLWILGVPERGVINRFDYPLGLPYLLFLGPFAFLLGKSIRNKELPFLPILAVIYWSLWWFGSQQSRFLYIPLFLIFITVSSRIKYPTKIFMFALMLSLIINFISVLRAHYRCLLLFDNELLRERDRELLIMNKEYFRQRKKDVIILDYFDAAYANFPIKVIPKKDSDQQWVLKY